MHKRLFNRGTPKGGCTVKGVLYALGLTLLFGAFPVRADTSHLMLSEKEAIRLGLDRTEIIQQMKASIELAESDLLEARTWANPEFSYDQESTDGPDEITERSYMLSQEFNLSGGRAIKTKAAKQRLDVVTQENTQWRMEITADIRQIFHMVLYQQHLHDIFTKWRTGMDSMEAVMHKRKEAGDISGYDFSRLKREQSFVQARQRQAHAEHERLWQELLTHIGLVTHEAPWTGVTGSLLPEPPTLPLENLLEHVAGQPDLMAIHLQSKAYSLDERLTRRWWLPDVTLGLGVKETEPADGDALFFSVSLPLPVFDRSSAARQKAKASRHQLENKYNLILSERKGMVRGLWHQAAELAGAVHLLDGEDCQSLVQTAEVAYKAGEIGVLELLDAYRIAFENQAQILSLKREARMVRIELDLITGGNIQ